MTHPNNCIAETKDGTPCKNPKWKNTKYCYIHRDFAKLDGQLQVSFLDRLSGIFQTNKKVRIGAIVGFLVGLVGFINALTGNSFIETMNIFFPCFWPNTCVDESNVLEMAYTMLEGQIETEVDCPEDLQNNEWQEFRKRLESYNFNRLNSSYKKDFEEYRDKFVEFLYDPPGTNFDCGVMRGELLVAVRPVLVDLEINESKAMSDGQGVPIAKGIGEMITGEYGLKNIYLVYLGFRPERFESLNPESRAFVEYLSIWMVMYFEDERVTAVEYAQGALLGMSPDNLEHTSTIFEDYRMLHEDLILLSRAHTDGDQTGVVRYGSSALSTLAGLSQTVITDEEAEFIGGDRILQIVQKLRDIATMGISGIHELEQMIEAFTLIKP